MKFVRAIWKLLVGIKDALVLLFMILFFALLYAGLSARPQPVGERHVGIDLQPELLVLPLRLGGHRREEQRQGEQVPAHRYRAAVHRCVRHRKAMQPLTLRRPSGSRLTIDL